MAPEEVSVGGTGRDPCGLSWGSGAGEEQSLRLG